VPILLVQTILQIVLTVHVQQLTAAEAEIQRHIVQVLLHTAAEAEQAVLAVVLQILQTIAARHIAVEALHQAAVHIQVEAAQAAEAVVLVALEAEVQALAVQVLAVVVVN
jgi:hypothetical protein